MTKTHTNDFDPNCDQCPRLAQFLEDVREQYPDYFAKPVPAFGDENARLCIVGLAPGMHGANATGRPFTGDHAGILLYQTLYKYGFASAPESLSADDGLKLINCRITNAVKCLPPENRPSAEEFSTCRPYLEKELQALKDLRVIIALGHGAHKSLLRLVQAQGLIKRMSEVPFGHGSSFLLSNGLRLVGCYHTSRYNVQTGRMNNQMFLELLGQVKSLLERKNG